MVHARACNIVGLVKIGIVFPALIACGNTPPNKPEPGLDAGLDARWDAAIDAAIDAPPDAAPAVPASYDIAYVSELTVNRGITGVDGFLLIINRGSAPLALATATVTSVDTDGGARLAFTKTTSSDVMLGQGRAAGEISIGARGKLVTSGLVSEPIDDHELDFAIDFLKLPAPGVDFHARVVLEVGGTQLALPFTFHMKAEDVESSLDAAQRIGTPAPP